MAGLPAPGALAESSRTFWCESSAAASTASTELITTAVKSAKMTQMVSRRASSLSRPASRSIVSLRQLSRKSSCRAITSSTELAARTLGSSSCQRGSITSKTM